MKKIKQKENGKKHITPKRVKCDCQKEATLVPGWEDLYDPVKELPFVNHRPGKCQCTNLLEQYILKGKKVWLCSCCIGQGEREI
jgi:hypothetical protein